MQAWVPLLLAALATPALAEPIKGEITAACMSAMFETETTCECIEESAALELTGDQQTFLLAVISENQNLINQLQGNFTEDDAKVVQDHMVAAAFRCIG